MLPKCFCVMARRRTIFIFPSIYDTLGKVGFAPQLHPAGVMARGLIFSLPFILVGSYRLEADSGG